MTNMWWSSDTMYCINQQQYNSRANSGKPPQVRVARGLVARGVVVFCAALWRYWLGVTVGENVRLRSAPLYRLHRHRALLFPDAITHCG